MRDDPTRVKMRDAASLGGSGHPRVIWAVNLDENGASRKPFDGDPYTRLASESWIRRAYMAQGCVRFKAFDTARLNRGVNASGVGASPRQRHFAKLRSLKA